MSTRISDSFYYGGGTVEPVNQSCEAYFTKNLLLVVMYQQYLASMVRE